MSTESYSVTQGAALNIVATLRDSSGAVLADVYNDTVPLSTTACAVGNLASAFSPTTTWASTAAGTIRIAVSDAQSASAPVGRYSLLTRLNDSDTIVDAYTATLDVLPSPGTATATGLITRLPIELELVDRAGALMTLCGKSTVATGNNPSLTGPIGVALAFFGGTPASPGFVTDADLATLAARHYVGIVDVSEYQLISNCLTGYVRPNYSVSLTSEQPDTMMRRFQDRAAQLAAQLKVRYGYGVGTLGVGSIKLGLDDCRGGRWRRGGGDF